MRLEIYMDVVEAAAIPGLVEVAEDIARDAARGGGMAEFRYQPNTKVHVTGDGVTVGNHNSFSVLDEWGSSKWPGTAPMRRAAADKGRFEPA